MTFAIVMSLVLFVSTAVLLYQFWSRSLLDSEADLGPGEQTPEAAPTPYFERAA